VAEEGILGANRCGSFPWGDAGIGFLGERMIATILPAVKERLVLSTAMIVAYDRFA